MFKENDRGYCCCLPSYMGVVCLGFMQVIALIISLIFVFEHGFRLKAPIIPVIVLGIMLLPFIANLLERHNECARLSLFIS